jgi:hypothetical protein
MPFAWTRPAAADLSQAIGRRTARSGHRSVACDRPILIRFRTATEAALSCVATGKENRMTWAVPESFGISTCTYRRRHHSGLEASLRDRVQ